MDLKLAISLDRYGLIELFFQELLKTRKIKEDDPKKDDQENDESTAAKKV